jgi:hypothetical protein
MAKSGRGRAIINGGITVLRRDPRLIALPVTSGVVVSALIAGFALVAISGRGLTGLGVLVETVRFYLALIALYLVGAFVVVFCNAALLYCANRGFTGQRATVGEGLAAAASRWPQILGWSLFVSTFRMVLTVLEPENVRTVKTGDELIFWLVTGLLVAPLKSLLSLFAYFVLPVMLIEQLGWSAAVKRATALISERWGDIEEESGGIGWIAFVCLLPLAGIAALIIYKAGSVSNAVLVPAAIITVLGIVAIAISFTALSAIFMAAAYAYAVTGVTPAPYDEDLMSELFEKPEAVKPDPADKPHGEAAGSP